VRISQWLSALLLASVVVVGGSATARDAGLPEAAPQSLGFSAERLKRLEQGMQGIVDQKQLAGIVTMVARHGKIVHQQAYGKLDVTRDAPIRKDSIVRIHSMTKPVVGVAMMMLYEEGKWQPSDPISRHIPEFAALKVYAGEKDGKPVFEAPKHAPTMRELMTHTAGFLGGPPLPGSPVDKMYAQANPLGADSLQGMIDRLAALPLGYQPGEAWVYSISVDVQGYLVEKLSGKSLPDFLRERIFEPLGMPDTAFYVPTEKMPRLATLYSWSADSKALAGSPHDPNVSKLPGLASGGGGLYSTAADYVLFAQMLLNEGELNGTRLLSPATVRLMRSNHTPESLQTGQFGLGIYKLRPGLGFGYDVAVFEDPHALGSTAGAGTYLWYGVGGTWFWVDPANDVIFIGIMQRRGGVPGTPDIQDLARAFTYQALVDPRK
jgi:CubicO group peptidase (beta-lactamase class C family)